MSEAGCCGAGEEAHDGVKSSSGCFGGWKDNDGSGGCCHEDDGIGGWQDGGAGGGCFCEVEGCSGDCGRSSQNALMNSRIFYEDITSSPSR